MRPAAIALLAGVLLAAGAAALAQDTSAATSGGSDVLTQLAKTCGKASFSAKCKTSCSIRNCLVARIGAAGAATAASRSPPPAASASHARSPSPPRALGSMFAMVRPLPGGRGCPSSAGLWSSSQKRAVVHQPEAWRQGADRRRHAATETGLTQRSCTADPMLFLATKLAKCAAALQPHMRNLPAACYPGSSGPSCTPCSPGTWSAGRPQSMPCQACPACPPVACKVAAPCDPRSGACRYSNAANGVACSLNNRPGQCTTGVCKVRARVDRMRVGLPFISLAGSVLGTAACQTSLSSLPWSRLALPQLLTCNVNGFQDSRETAPDCGGGMCPPCADYLTCKLDSDCRSDFCKGDIVVEGRVLDARLGPSVPLQSLRSASPFQHPLTPSLFPL